MRDALRAIRFNPVNDERPDYIGMAEWDLQTFGIDAYEVRIWVGTQLPMEQPIQLNLEPH